MRKISKNTYTIEVHYLNEQDSKNLFIIPKGDLPGIMICVSSYHIFYVWRHPSLQF